MMKFYGVIRFVFSGHSHPGEKPGADDQKSIG
jgi:hypothetical protein